MHVRCFTCFNKKKKTRKPWSHIDIKNLKSNVNLLGKQLKQRPFDRTLRNDYFITAKKKKKLKKKYQFKQNFI